MKCQKLCPIIVTRGGEKQPCGGKCDKLKGHELFPGYSKTPNKERRCKFHSIALKMQAIKSKPSYPWRRFGPREDPNEVRKVIKHIEKRQSQKATVVVVSSPEEVKGEKDHP